MAQSPCIKCKKLKEVPLEGKTKGYCKTCYKRYLWKPKLKICKRCSRRIQIHAKGLCTGCYNSVFHIDKVKIHNAKKYHQIDSNTYKKITKECIVCGFDKIVEIHHLDHNHSNNSNNNLLGLCPNCHKMIHSKKYQPEIYLTLKNKGFKVPEGYSFDGYYNKYRKGSY